jgi:hypothetical protein
MYGSVKKLGGHLRGQWMGALALFLILAGGSAFGGTMAAKSALSKKEKNQAKAIAAAAIQAAAPTLSVANATAAGAADTAAQGGTGRQSTGTGSCDPSTTRIACAVVSITLNKPGRVLVNAAAAVASGGIGDCQLGSTSGSDPVHQRPGDRPRLDGREHLADRRHRRVPGWNAPVRHRLRRADGSVPAAELARDRSRALGEIAIKQRGRG